MQQLILTRAIGNLQPMVATYKEDVRRRWKTIFNAALDEVGMPKGRGRATAVREKIDNVVSRFAVVKWLTGETIPDQTHLQIISEKLGIDMRKLQIAERAPAWDDDSFARKLATVWKNLNDDVKGQIVGFALVHATTLPVDPPKLPSPKGDPDNQEGLTGNA